MSCWDDCRRPRGAVWTIGPCPPGSAQSPAGFRKIPPRPQSSAVASSAATVKYACRPHTAAPYGFRPPETGSRPAAPAQLPDSAKTKKKSVLSLICERTDFSCDRAAGPFPPFPGLRPPGKPYGTRGARADYSLFPTRCTVVWVALKKPKSRIAAPERA